MTNEPSPQRSRYFRVWATDGDLSPANPENGYASADDAEGAVGFPPVPGYDERIAALNVKDGIISVAVVR